MPRQKSLVSAGTLALVSALAPSNARADGREVAARVAEQWDLAGARATRLPARFLFDDETVVVPLPPDDTGAACTTVAVVGARGLSFHAKLEGASADPLSPEPGARAASHAGVLELRRCDPDRSVRHVVVTSDAGRGAVEIVVARSARGLPSLAVVAPERTGGALPPVPDAGALPILAPTEKRAEAGEARARRDGGVVEARDRLRAGDDGGGDSELELGEGCHRLELFAPDPRAERPGRRFRLDLDGELRDPTNDRLLARDRTEAPDVRMETCLGRPQVVSLAFAGAAPRTEVTLTHASWPLPARLPTLWGHATRGKMARVMFARHVAVPAHDPIFLGQGSAGTTSFPLPVEVGGCYVAVVGLTHGHARSLQLRAVVGARESTDERGAAEEAALTAFCVQAEERARLDVQARGPGVGFGLAVFRVKSAVWEAGR